MAKKKQTENETYGLLNLECPCCGTSLFLADDKTKWDEGDHKWGFRFGCKGTMNKRQVSEFIGKSERTVDRLIDNHCIRSGKLDYNGDKSNLVLICRRSVEEYLAGIKF